MVTQWDFKYQILLTTGYSDSGSNQSDLTDWISLLFWNVLSEGVRIVVVWIGQCHHIITFFVEGVSMPLNGTSPIRELFVWSNYRDVNNVRFHLRRESRGDAPQAAEEKTSATKCDTWTKINLTLPKFASLCGFLSVKSARSPTSYQLPARKWWNMKNWLCSCFLLGQQESWKFHVLVSWYSECTMVVSTICFNMFQLSIWVYLSI